MKPVILFVDDNPNILSGLRRAMRGNTDLWDMSFVDSGDAALELVAQQPIDLIVTDMRMPGMDGAQLLEKISNTAPGVLRFALSGESDVGQAIRIVGKSHRFLAKPIEPEALAEAINTLFDSSGAFGDGHCVHNSSAFDCLRCARGRLDALGALVAAPEKNHTQITAHIMSDPSLSVRMLQLCNSAYFGKPLHTTSIPKAVSYVGSTRLAKLLENDRLGTEMAPDTVFRDDHVLRAMAAMIAREHVATAGLGEDMQDLAYATALFSELGRTSQEAADCPTKPACIAALFGLPDKLVTSLNLFCSSEVEPHSEDEIAALAVATSKRARARAKEAA